MTLPEPSINVSLQRLPVEEVIWWNQANDEKVGRWIVQIAVRLYGVRENSALALPGTAHFVVRVSWRPDCSHAYQLLGVGHQVYGSYQAVGHVENER